MAKETLKQVFSYEFCDIFKGIFFTGKSRLATSVSSKGSDLAAIKISVNHYVKIISGALLCVKSVRIRSFLVRIFLHSDQKNSEFGHSLR